MVTMTFEVRQGHLGQDHTNGLAGHATQLDNSQLLGVVVAEDVVDVVVAVVTSVQLDIVSMFTAGVDIFLKYFSSVNR